jgi:2-haloacid dehalogenase
MPDVLGMRPEDIGLVAAHNSDLAAAHNSDLAAGRACGLKTVFVPRPMEHGPAQTTDLRAEQDWDVVATSFEDLATQLGL